MRLLAAFLAAALVAGWPAWAGNGPHNWLVVYDPDDSHGAAIARYYQEKRGFPESSLLPYSFPRRATSSPAIKHQLTVAEGWTFLQTVRSNLTARGLTNQIHGITLVGNAPNSMTTSNIGVVSLTSALSLSPGVTNTAAWENRLENEFTEVFRGPNNATTAEFRPTTEVRSDIGFGVSSNKFYWLSTHLGFTGLHGLRPDEVFTLIDRAAAADGTAPAGTVYWPLNGDVRSTCRSNQVPYVAAEWDNLGLRYYAYNGSTPDNKTNAPATYPHTNRAVQGAVCGVWVFNLDDKPSLYTPGAIAEQLTSFGGVMGGTLDWNQSECTLWLRAGAAGTSGTVTEPFATWTKFPHSRIHSHYFNGATLAEAFLQSVYCPYQLLVMGDGLCQPYAQIPQVTIGNVTNGQTLAGPVTILASATRPGGVETNLDLAVNGRVVRIGQAGEPVGATRVAGGFALDTTTLADGWQELRVIAYGADAIRPQGFAVREVFVHNTAGSLTLTGPTNAVFGATLAVTATPVNLTGVTAVEIRSLGQVLATLGAGGGTANIPAAKLSYQGANRLFAVAKLANGREVWSTPLAVAAQWQPWPAPAEAATLPGAVAIARVFTNVTMSGFNWNTTPPAAVMPVTDRYAIYVEKNNQWPYLAGNPQTAGQVGGMEFVTRFYARETGLYDFVLSATAASGLVVDGTEVQSAATGMPMFTVPLAAGWHELKFRVRIPASGTDRPFEPAFRARYTRRFHRMGQPVAEYEHFTLDHCAAPAAVALTAPQLAGRATAAGEAQMAWTDPLTTETGWNIERYVGDPGVTLVEYRGTNTPPLLVDRFAPAAMGPLTRTANDHTEDVFTQVPPFLQGGQRLVAARADRTYNTTNILYRVNVPAGVTMYAVFKARNAAPTWITTQGDWTKIADWASGYVGNYVESASTSLWQVHVKTNTTAGVVELGGPPNETIRGGADAITFVFARENPWATVASFAANTTNGTVTGLAAVAHRFRVSANVPRDARIPSGEVVLDLTAATANGAPVVSAGSNAQMAGTGQPVPLPGWVQDDGLPNPPGALTSAWSQVSGPGTVSFAAPTVPATTATFSQPGTYTLQLWASDGALSASNTVQVTVTGDSAANNPPVVNAGADRNLPVTTSVELAGSASDDGLPNPPARVLTQWRQLSGPAPVTFDDPSVLNAQAYFSTPGVYVLELSATDGQKTGSDTVTFSVAPDPNQPPVVNAGADHEVYAQTNITVTGTASDDGLSNPPGVLSLRWRQLSGPAAATISNATALTTKVWFPELGEYVLALQADDGGVIAQDTATYTVIRQTEGNTAPVIGLTGPLQFEAPGTYFVDPQISDDGLPKPPGAVTATWEVLAGPGQTAAVADYEGTQSLLAFDAPGQYTLRLVADDGLLQTTGTVTAVVADTHRYRNVYAWGDNSSYQCGPFVQFPSWRRITPPANVAWRWKQVAIGADSVYALDDAGTVSASGTNLYYQLGMADLTVARRHFATVPGLSNIVQIAHYGYGGVALRADGTVWTWGYGLYGQSGNGTTTDRATPTLVSGLNGVQAIAAQANAILAVRTNGTVWGWGRNSWGQLGTGTTNTQQATPVQMIGITNAVKAAVGSDFSVVLLRDGTLRSCGSNSQGQLGDGTTNNAWAPVVVVKSTAPYQPLTDVTEIAAGGAYAIAADTTGAAWAWGYNQFGRLGIGQSYTKTNLATQVRDNNDSTGYLTGVRKVAASSVTTYAAKDNGDLRGWGYGYYNAWGDPNNTSTRYTAGPVINLPAVTDVWAGEYSAFAISGPATYETFAYENFTDAERAAGQATPNADPDGDGQPNLLEWILQTNPRQANVGPWEARRNGDEFVFDVEYLRVGEGVVVEFQTSTDMHNWGPAAPSSIQHTDRGELRHTTLRFNIGPDQTRLFLRMKVATTKS